MNTPLLLLYSAVNASLAGAVAFCLGRMGRRPAPAAILPSPADALDDLAAAVEAGAGAIEAAAGQLRAAADDAAARRHAGGLLRSGRTFEGRLGRHGVRLEAAAQDAEECRRMAAEAARHKGHVADFCGKVEAAAAGPATDAAAILAATADLAGHNGRLMRELEETKARLADRERRLEAAERDARVDPLTRVANRRAFEERLAECRARLERGHETFAVAVFDLDRFKAVNDTLGHAGGDAVLQVFARVLADAVRPYDLAARLGGEEFAVLMPGADLDGALTAAERVRRRAEGASVRHDGRRIGFTVSGGVASGHAGDPPGEPLGRADAALYTAKAGGRNRVCAADEPDADGPRVRVEEFATA